MELPLNNWRQHFHGFVVIPLLIVAIGILPVGLTVAILKDTGGKTPADYLQAIEDQRGNARWRAAYQLSMLVNDRNGIAMKESLADRFIRIFNSSSIEADDPKLRPFLALVMGRTGHAEFLEPLLDALSESKDESGRATFIRALGYLGEERAVPQVTAFLTHKDATVRHEAVQALGNIGSKLSVEPLKRMLDDPIPEVRWDATIGLTKMKDASGKKILKSLLDESYYAGFPNVTPAARDWAMEVAIRTSVLLEDQDLNAIIRNLASSGNIKVKQAALSAMKRFSI